MNRVHPDSEVSPRTQVEGQDSGRLRWIGKYSFLMATLGSVINFGSFWRFGFVVYINGGLIFFIPYLIILGLVGIPMLLLELALGQKHQRGIISVMSGINPRAIGIGFASIFAVWWVAVYTATILSWAVYYFFLSFATPLEWSGEGYDVKWGGGTTKEYFYRNFLKYQKDTCLYKQPKETDEVAWFIWLWSLLVWTLIYFIVFKGVRSTSHVVAGTVPLKLCLLVFLMITFFCLEGVGEGMDILFTGEHNTTFGKRFEKIFIWTNALAETFLSLNLCLGIMTAYGSYNLKGKPVVRDSFIIAFANTAVNILFAFWAFSVIGNLRDSGNPARTQTGYLGLTFIAYPAAAAEMAGANFWSLMIFLMVFLIGIDSVSSMIEAISTVIHDTEIGKKVDRMWTTLVIWFTGFLFGLLYCSDIGYILLDVTDYYVTIYVLSLICIFKCGVVGWVYELKEISNKVSMASLIVYISGFWFLVIIMPTISVNAYNSLTWTTIVIQFSLLPVLVVVSWLFSRQNTFSEWFDIVFYSGVRKVSKYMTLISSKEKSSFNEKEWWEPIFKFWWCFSIKYAIPLLVTHGIIFQFRTDAKTRYQGYPLSVNFLGWSILIVALLIVVIPIFIFTKSVSNPDHVDRPFELMAMEHFTEQVVRKEKPKPKEEKKNIEMKSADASDIDQSKSPIRTNRSIVATESNVRLDEED